MSVMPSAIVYVTYAGSLQSHFDSRYYVERHLPLVMEAWRRYGLEEVTAFFPPAMQLGTRVICECRFRDEMAMNAAFGSPEAQEVMADVHKFTDLSPLRLRGVKI